MEYEAKQRDSPSYRNIVLAKSQEQRKLASEYLDTLKRAESEMRIISTKELIGVALLVRDTIDTSQAYETETIERQGFVPTLSDFSREKNRINNEYSKTTHERMKSNPNEWYRYHTLLEEASSHWDVIPVRETINRIKQLSATGRIGDFGCGKAQIMEEIGSERVYSYDHIAINDKVTSSNGYHIYMKQYLEPLSQNNIII